MQIKTLSYYFHSFNQNDTLKFLIFILQHHKVHSKCFKETESSLFPVSLHARLNSYAHQFLPHVPWWDGVLTQNSWLLHIQNLHIYTHTCLFLHWFSFQHPHLNVCKAFAMLSLPPSLPSTDFWLFLSHVFSVRYWSELLLCFSCEFSLLKNNVLTFFFLLYLWSSIHHIICRKAFLNKAVVITALKSFTLSQFGAANL